MNICDVLALSQGVTVKKNTHWSKEPVKSTITTKKEKNTASHHVIQKDRPENKQVGKKKKKKRKQMPDKTTRPCCTAVSSSAACTVLCYSGTETCTSLFMCSSEVQQHSSNTHGQEVRDQTAPVEEELPGFGVWWQSSELQKLPNVHTHTHTCRHEWTEIPAAASWTAEELTNKQPVRTIWTTSPRRIFKTFLIFCWWLWRTGRCRFIWEQSQTAFGTFLFPPTVYYLVWL